MSFNFKSTLKSEDIPFNLPDNWSWYKWGDLITDYQQGLIRSNRELTESGVPYLKMNNLNNSGGYDLHKMEYTTVSNNELEKYKLHKGDFLLNVRNSKELVGKTCVIGNHNFDIVYNHMLVRIKHLEGISGIYINALLKIPVMRKFIDRCKSGTTTVIALYQRDLYDIPIPLPDKSTHDSIVAFAENISSKIELNNRINAELEAMAKTLYDYWFVQFDFPIDTALAAKMGDPNLTGKPYKTSGGIMVWNEELKREIPEGWGIIYLRTEIEIQRGISYTSKEINGDGIPMINLNSFNLDGTYKSEGVKTYSGKFSEKNIVKSGDLLIAATDVTRNADIVGRAILVPDYYNENLVFSMDIAKIISKNIPSSFLMMLFNSDHYHNYIKWYATGTLVLHLNLDGVNRYQTELPPKSLLKKFDEFYLPIANRIYMTAKENEKLTELRDWLLPLLMNGQVHID
jgi:type I restriction enzyme S subunit